MKHLLFVAITSMMFCYSCKKDDKSVTPTPAPVTTPTPITTIGASYGGGITCYVDASGQHGLIAAPVDQSTAIKWYEYTNSQIFTGMGDYESIGTGASNTAFIVGFYGPGNYAAYVCDTLTIGGYTDWFLPSRNELQTMFSIYPGHGITDNLYISSTEDGSNAIWEQSYTIGQEATAGNKALLRHVRAMRYF